MDGQYGLLDVKVKAVLAADTVAARAAVPVVPVVPVAPAGAAAEGEEPRPLHKRRWAQIAASLDMVARQTRNHYEHIGAVQPVVPIVISSGGTFQLQTYQFIHQLFPDAKDRQRLITEISVALVRARGQVYHLD